MRRDTISAGNTDNSYVPTAQELLAAYARGYFPMAEGRHEQELYWYAPEQRGILPLETFHVPRSLGKFMRGSPYTVTVDKAFEQVIRACADMRTARRSDSWINDAIIRLYCELAHSGFAHSVECWQEGKLVGGLYGVCLGGAFFGESMFSLAPECQQGSACPFGWPPESMQAIFCLIRNM